LMIDLKKYLASQLILKKVFKFNKLGPFSFREE
jgi:hypothetical protein